jgi:hypothetical protein
MKTNVILYAPDGREMHYPDAEVSQSIVPDLHFFTTVNGVRVSFATTLPYILITPLPESTPDA